MPDPTTNLGNAARHAQAAVQKMAEHRLAPEPNAYAVWFHYSAQTDCDLNAALDRLIARKQPLGPDIIEDLYQRFIGSGAEGKVVAETNSKVQDLLSGFLEVVSRTGKDTTEFADLLKVFSDQLGGGGSLDQIVQTVRLAATKMEAQSRNLESELSESLDEITRLKEDLERARVQATTDGLTDLANRRHFDATLRQETTSAGRRSSPLTLIMTDIDHFKRFNDTHGHQLGDQVIQLVARSLRDGISDRGTAARYGGEEFGIILPDTRLADAVTIAEKIRQSVESKRILKKSTGETIGDITLTCGVAQFLPGENAENFVARADAALYIGKQAGRNCVLAADGEVSEGNAA